MEVKVTLAAQCSGGEEGDKMALQFSGEDKGKEKKGRVRLEVMGIRVKIGG